MFSVFFKAATCAALVCGAVPATAATVVFNTTGNMVDNGAYGNSLNFTSTTGNVHVNVSGWQVNQSTNAVTSAYTGAYSPGTGVTGLGDANGSGAFHQIDNAFGYTDFVLLTFDRAVNLTAVGLNAFQMTNVSGVDNDLAYRAITGGPIALTGSTNNAALWTTVNSTGLNGSASNGSRATGSSAYANQWLIGAAFNSGANDGFKLASLTVNTGAVPEPATWAMMLIGFGAAGVSLRRKRPVLAMQAA